MIYAVTRWAREFENDRSRGLARVMWLPLPNRFDSSAYWRLMEEPDAPVLFASWVWILQVASRCPTRGVLVKDNGIAHDARSLAERVRGRPEWFERALAYFLGAGWLCLVQADTGPCGEARFLQPPRTAGGRVTLYATVSADSPSVERGSRMTGSHSRIMEDDSAGARSVMADGPMPAKSLPSKTFELPFTPQNGSAPAGARAFLRSQQKKKKKPQSLKDCGSKSLAMAGATLGPTREVVMAFAAGCAIPEPAAEAFMEYFARREWRDAYGRPVFSWRGRLRVWAKDWDKRTKNANRLARGLDATERAIPIPERLRTREASSGPSCAIPELVAGLRRAVAEAQPLQRPFERRTSSKPKGVSRTVGLGEAIAPAAPPPPSPPPSPA